MGDGSPVTKTIGPDGGEVSLDGVTVTIPPGALDESVDIKITRLSSSEAAALFDGEYAGTSLELASAVYAFTPHGTRFNDLVDIVFDGDEGAELVLRLDDPNDETWEMVSDASFEGGQAYVQTDHFSYYAAFSLRDHVTAPKPELCEQSCPEVDQILSCNGERAGCWKPSESVLPEEFRFGTERITTSYGVDLDDPNAATYLVWQSTEQADQVVPTEYRLALMPLGVDGTVGALEVTEPFSVGDQGGQLADMMVKGVYPASGGYVVVGGVGFDRLMLPARHRSRHAGRGAAPRRPREYDLDEPSAGLQLRRRNRVRKQRFGHDLPRLVAGDGECERHLRGSRSAK